jgi:hypothetical protein
MALNKLNLVECALWWNAAELSENKLLRIAKSLDMS